MRPYVNTASFFCMLVIRKFLLSTEYTEDIRNDMTDTSENRCDKISVLSRKDKFSTILAHYLLYVYIIRVSSILSWTRNLK